MEEDVAINIYTNNTSESFTLYEVDIDLEICGDSVTFFLADDNDNGISLNREEAIAAARAILVHFGEE